jgi:histidyl-tRNA synthetase
MKINIPKGTKDVLPSESYKWQYIEKKARQVCRLYNIKEIRTPTFEHTELFVRSVGEDTDIVGKEMYTFLDKAGRSLTLKAEGTAPVARSYIENSLSSLSLPLKMFYITPVFRYERPQAGRYREHHQFGIEIYGDDSADMDGEVIEVADRFLKSVGLKNTKLNINTIGCSDCRAEYIKELKGYLSDKEQSMCSQCQKRFFTNPLRILDCKEQKCKDIASAAPKIIDYICFDCSTHFKRLKQNLKVRDIDFVVNPWIVRGLDYYTRTVFEFTSTDLGAQGTICGGGRYDGLVASIGGKDTPCVGFGLGLERLLILMDAANVNIDQPTIDYFIIVQSNEYKDYCINLCSQIRSLGHSVDMDYTGRSFNAQFKYANKQNAKNVIVIGKNEVDSGQIEIKRLSDGFTQKISLDEFLQR